MADAADSKSAIREGVRVQVPSSAPRDSLHRSFGPGVAGLFGEACALMARHRSLEQLGAIIVRGDTVRAPISVDAPPVDPRDWELAVGTKIARRARPTKLERGVLHVRTASSTWAQELSLLADAITAQLRARGLDVRSLRFQVGPVEPLKRPAWRTEVKRAPEPVALPPDVNALLAAVPDDDLRAAIARAAAASLGQLPPDPTPKTKTAKRAPRAAPEPPAATSPRSAAPAPRSAAARSARPDRTIPERPAAPRGKRGATSPRGS